MASTAPMDDREIRILCDAELGREIEFCYSHQGVSEQPDFTRAAWRDQVAKEETISGYWEWVRHKLSIEREKFQAQGLI